MRKPVATAVLAGAALLGACAPDDDQVAAELSASFLSPELPPREEVTSIGREIWRFDLELPPAQTFAVAHTGATFVLTVQTDDGLRSTVGSAETGEVKTPVELPAGAGWPSITGDPTAPTVAAATPADLTSAPGSTTDAGPATAITAWDGTTGAIRWTQTAAQLGAASDTGLRIDGTDSNRIVARTLVRPASPYEESSLWLLDADTGATVWSTSPGPMVRWSEANHGLLLYTWRSDDATDQPSDRVTIRELATGAELATLNVINDYGDGGVMLRQCGGIAAPDRVVLCRWLDDDREVLLTDHTGMPIREWSSPSKPVIDDATGVVAITTQTAAGEPGLIGVDTVDGNVLWSYDPGEVRDYGLEISSARDGLMFGALGTLEMALSSRTGQWLIADNIFYLRRGAVVGNRVVEYRNGAAVGYTATGVGVGTLRDDDDSVLFVSP